MKTYSAIMLVMLSLIMATLTLTGCKGQTQEEKIKKAVTEKVYALSAEERQLAMTNAKAYFEKEWPVQEVSKDENGNRKVETHKERGVVTMVRPSDSNANGLVTTIGMIPQLQGGFKEVKVYCGYRPELVGCSDEDTVKP